MSRAKDLFDSSVNQKNFVESGVNKKKFLECEYIHSKVLKNALTWTPPLPYAHVREHAVLDARSINRRRASV